jgi:hypothetical protein
MSITLLYLVDAEHREYERQVQLDLWQRAMLGEEAVRHNSLPRLLRRGRQATATLATAMWRWGRSRAQRLLAYFQSTFLQPQETKP